MRRIILMTILAGCTTVEERLISLRPGDTACDSTGPSSSSSSDSSSTSSEESSSSTDESSSTGDSFICPDLRGGAPHSVGRAVTFCPPELGGICRDVLVVNGTSAVATGPIVVEWHGTYEDPDSYLSWDYATGQLRTRVQNDAGVLMLPYADTAATSRDPVDRFPWWVVGDEDDPAWQTDRPDDFVLFETIVNCAIEQGLGSANRVGTTGMSAGAIQVSHIVDRHDNVAAGFEIAGAVSHSGGLPPGYQPATPTAQIPMMLSQGGTTDVYPQGCMTGSPNCYSFVQPTEHLASAVVDAGGYAFVCRHPWGHGSYFGVTAAAFLGDARANLAQHPWQPFTTTHANSWEIQYCGEAL